MSPPVRHLHSRCPALLLGTFAVAPSLAAQAAPLPPAAASSTVVDSTVVVREVAPGVVYRRLVRPAGAWVVHAVAVDLRRPDLAVRAVRACDALTGRERPSAIARRLRAAGTDVVAVLNADFFDLEGGTGANENNVVVDGELVKGVGRTESPFDTFDNAHTQFAVSAAGAPLLERYRLSGTVRTARGTWPLAGVNAAAPPPRGAAALFTGWAGAATPPAADTARTEVPLVRLDGAGDTTRYRVAAAPRRGGATPVPEGGAVIAAAGAAGRAIARLRTGDRVSVVATLTPRRARGERLHTLVGGWPRIVRAGRNVAARADAAEGTFPRFSRARHPRSAVGFSRDSATLYLVAVDGRRPARSAGMSLAELADQMLALGAHDALNLDGGGSTALVVGDSVVNAPSDPSGERPVGDVIAVTRGGKGDTRPVPAPRPPETCVRSGNRDPDRKRD